MDDIAILDNVLFAFLSVLTRLLDLSHGRFGGDTLEIVKGAHFSLDETAFEIRVNHSGGLRGGGAVVYGPASNFFLYRAASRKEFSSRAVSRESVGVARRRKSSSFINQSRRCIVVVVIVYICAPPAVK